jgi:DNA-binding Lrp family transcriptional regulator
MVRAYVLISTQPGRAMDVVSHLTGQDGIVQSDAITGEYDVIAQVEAGDVAGVGALIVEKIQRIDGVFKTVTCLAVK